VTDERLEAIERRVSSFVPTGTRRRSVDLFARVVSRSAASAGRKPKRLWYDVLWARRLLKEVNPPTE
jgi:hypothetical protein